MAKFIRFDRHGADGHVYIDAERISAVVNPYAADYVPKDGEKPVTLIFAESYTHHVAHDINAVLSSIDRVLNPPAPSATETRPRVKALKWSHRPDDPEFEVCADTPFGRYKISDRGEYGYGWQQPRSSVMSGYAESLDAAKEAAQKDFNIRVSESVETVPGGN